MEQSGNIPIFNNPGRLPNISRNFIGRFSKYSGSISWECSTNIPRTYICLMGMFYHFHFQKIIQNFYLLLENMDQLSDLNIGFVHMCLDLIDIYSS